MNHRTRYAIAVLAAVLLALVPVNPVSAHTEADVIAVPAGEQATVNLRPTHGCGDSPTIAVAIQAPVPGATAGNAPGWEATSTTSGEKTVLEWTGGSLAPDATGSFPVNFTAPDTVGELLTFPAIQTCENGEELSWISGDPDSDYPVPRILILPAGTEPASSINQVPADAPGRDKLTAVIDTGDSGTGDTTSTSPSQSSVDSSVDSVPKSTMAPAGTNDGAGASDVAVNDADADDDGSGGVPSVVFIVIAIVIVIGGAGAVVVLRRRSQD